MTDVRLLPECRPHKTWIWSQKGLTEIRWSGDDRTSGFLEQWGYAVEHVRDEVSEQTLNDMLFRCVPWQTL